MKIALIGYGNLGKAIAKCLSRKHEIIATKRNLDVKAKSKRIEITNNNAYAVKNAECVIIAVKPKDISPVLEEIKDYVENKLVISFVAFVSLKEIKSKINARVVRAMGNIGIELGKSFVAYYTENGEDEKLLSILSLMGKVYKAENEREIDLMTVFSGSAPAFVARLIDAFVLAGLKHGLNAELSKELALSIFNATAELLKRETTESLIKRIATPGGTTIEGLMEMEKHRVVHGIASSIGKAVEKIFKKE